MNIFSLFTLCGGLAFFLYGMTVMSKSLEKMVLAPIHYLWSVKILSPQPILYAVAALVLLALRYKKFRQWWR